MGRVGMLGALLLCCSCAEGETTGQKAGSDAPSPRVDASMPGGSGGVGGLGGTGGAGGVGVTPGDEDAGADDAGVADAAAVGDAGTDAGGPAPLMELPYWIEALQLDTRAVLWVKLDLPKGKLTLRLQYGDKALGPRSNIEDTFLFGDDFSGSAVDTARWTVTDATGWSVAGGQLRGTNTTGRLKSVATFKSTTQPVVSEARFKVTTLPTNGYMVNGVHESAGNGFGVLIHQVPNGFYTRTNGAWSAFTTWPSGDYVADWARCRVTLKTGAQAVAELSRDVDGANAFEQAAAFSVIDDPITLGYRYDEMLGGQAYDAVWDFLFVRKYAAVAPTVTVNADDGPNGLCKGCMEKTITIDNTAGAVQTDYSVRIDLDAAHADFWDGVTSGGDDIRVGL